MLLFVVYGTAPVVVAAVQTNSNDASGNWTRGDPQGDGTASVTSGRPDVAGLQPQDLDGQIYGEPLAWDGHVYVASESDTVYTLSAATGRRGGAPPGHARTLVGLALRRHLADGGDHRERRSLIQQHSEVFVVTDELVDQHPPTSWSGSTP